MGIHIEQRFQGGPRGKQYRSINGTVFETSMKLDLEDQSPYERYVFPTPIDYVFERSGVDNII